VTEYIRQYTVTIIKQLREHLKQHSI